MSRRGKLPAWLFVLALIASVALVTGIPYLIAADDAQSPGYELVPSTLTLPPGMQAKDLTKAMVYEVVDGDSLDVIIDGKFESLRYYGVDTPERNDPCYRDALERNRRLVGNTVYLLSDARDRDPFARLLRYVFKADGTSIDATLVAEGLGHAWRQDGAYRDELVRLEADARAAGRGCLWASEVES